MKRTTVAGIIATAIIIGLLSGAVIGTQVGCVTVAVQQNKADGIPGGGNPTLPTSFSQSNAMTLDPSPTITAGVGLGSDVPDIGGSVTPEDTLQDDSDPPADATEPPDAPDDTPATE